MFQLLDDSFGYLVSFRITQVAMREVIQRASRHAEAIRGVYDPSLINDLFGTPIQQAVQYDIVLR